ncbi:acid protease [Thozetella sp. PMI_491]|nr:acid protease [Thozetella sp. PMI_491]
MQVQSVRGVHVFKLNWAVLQNYVELGIGTPVKSYRLLFDTGSALSWVADDKCASECINYSGYQKVGYNVANSSTGRLLGQYGSIDYLDGETVGPIASDVFSIEHVSWNQSFLAANDSNSAALPVDGYLSLAFDFRSAGSGRTPFAGLLQNNLLDSPRFGIQYGPTNKNGLSGGVLTLGGSRESEFSQGPLATIPVTKSPSGRFDTWRASLRAISGSKTVNGTKVTGETTLDAWNAIFDTSSSRSTLPRDKIVDFYDTIGLNWTAILWGQRLPPCTAFNSSWSYTLSFEATPEPVNVTVTGDQFLRPGYGFRDTACQPPFEESAFGSDVVLGTPFLSNFYSVWDLGSKEESKFKLAIGLGKRKTN